jgi:hypothetical protein
MTRLSLPLEPARHGQPLPSAELPKPSRLAGVHLAHQAKDALGMADKPAMVANGGDELKPSVDVGVHGANLWGRLAGFHTYYT